MATHLLPAVASLWERGARFSPSPAPPSSAACARREGFRPAFSWRKRPYSHSSACFRVPVRHAIALEAMPCEPLLPAVVHLSLCVVRAVLLLLVVYQTGEESTAERSTASRSLRWSTENQTNERTRRPPSAVLSPQAAGSPPSPADVGPSSIVSRTPTPVQPHQPQPAGIVAPPRPATRDERLGTGPPRGTAASFTRHTAPSRLAPTFSPPPCPPPSPPPPPLPPRSRLALEQRRAELAGRDAAALPSIGGGLADSIHTQELTPATSEGASADKSTRGTVR